MSPPPHGPRAAAAPAWAVSLLLLVLLAIDLVCVARWGRDIPLAEDWMMVPALTGHQPDMAAWLWSQNNEHRLPLPRLVYWLLLESTHDFRSGMVLSQLLLAATAAALARAVWLARGGRSGWADLLVPLALLCIGHWENLMWGWQLQFVVSVALAGLLLAALVAAPGRLAGRRALLAATSVLLLPLAGANGLVVAVPMLPWIAWQGWLHWRDARGGPPSAGASPHWPAGAPPSRRTGLLLLGAAAGALLLVAVYFVGYQRPGWSPPPPSARQFASMLLRDLGMAFGPGVAHAWRLAMALAMAVFLPSALLLARAAWRASPLERPRALGLAAFGLACACLSIAIAYGRGADAAKVPDRYALLSALSLIAASCAWTLYGHGRWRHRVPALLLLCLAAWLPFNLLAARQWRDWYVQGMDRVRADLAAGVPIAALARDHHEFLMHWNEQVLRENMRLLRAAGIGPFASARAD